MKSWRTFRTQRTLCVNCTFKPKLKKRLCARYKKTISQYCCKKCQKIDNIVVLKTFLLTDKQQRDFLSPREFNCEDYNTNSEFIKEWETIVNSNFSWYKQEDDDCCI